MEPTRIAQGWRGKLLPLYMVGMFVLPTILAIFLLRPGPRGFDRTVLVLGVVYAVLLAGLFVVMLLTPSNAKEMDRVVDTEASTVTLGMTLYACYFYPTFQEAFEAPELHPLMVVAFIIVVYVISKLILRLKYR